jgi:hypothetical protein
MEEENLSFNISGSQQVFDFKLSTLKLNNPTQQQIDEFPITNSIRNILNSSRRQEDDIRVNLIKNKIQEMKNRLKKEFENISETHSAVNKSS